MTNLVHCVTFQLLLIVFAVSGWKAVPANQAMYTLRGAHHYGATSTLNQTEIEAWPRVNIHSIYKFGWCTPDSIQKVFLRKTANLTLGDLKSAHGRYIYLLEDGDTIDHRLACIVLTIWVPRHYLFRNSRIPIYYCQGDLHLVQLMTYTRYDLHEFYLHQNLDMPANLHFAFYHPPRL